MNTLSWMIYWVDFISRFNGFIEGMLAFSIAATIMLWLLKALFYGPDQFAKWDDDQKGDNAQWQAFIKMAKFIKRWAIVATSGIVIFALLWIIIPSKEALVLILGSEVSEQIGIHDDVADMYQTSRRIILKKLNELETD